jgi:hypothetical protein
MTPKERNVLWMTVQKPQCMSCANVIYTPPAMKCRALPIAGRGHLGKTSGHEYCIDARDGACGDEAVLYEANVRLTGGPSSAAAG